MTFLHSQWLIPAALAVAAGVLLALRGATDHARSLARYGGAAQIRRMLRGRFPRAALGRLFAGLGLAALLVALAGPLVGQREETVLASGADVMVALDVSASMAATDVKPSRLGRAVHRIETLLEALPGHRVGLVIFAGDAFLAVPLTRDHGAVRLYLDAVRVGMVPHPGSSLEAAVTRAVVGFGEGPGGRALVLFSDGEATAGDSEAAVARARRSGVTALTVGMGGTAGVPIPLLGPEGRFAGYKRDRQGKMVTTRLEPDALATLADRTGGSFFVSSLEGGEVADMARAIATMEQGEARTESLARPDNRYQWPLALAVVLLLGGLILPPRRVPEP